MNTTEIKNKINAGLLDESLKTECSISDDRISYQRDRFISSIDEFTRLFGDSDDIRLFSVGGRSEISGNHTDHNHGRVIAASINLDILAVVKKTDDRTITIKSEGFPIDAVTKDEWAEPEESRFFTSASIIAGMEKAFANAGYNVGGFTAYTTSNVLKGSGLSSSAAFEVMVGNILNHLYNDGKVSNVEIAKMAQYAENVYFGKPCGLMDQTACAVGGFITIDFKDPSSPVIERMDFDLYKNGYSLCITNTGGNHADLNEDYASVPSEMKKVAALFGKDVLREVSFDEVLGKACEIREKLGDRAFLRAMHFIAENERVGMQVKALKENNTDAFLDGATGSGNSSFKFLQNVYTTKNIKEQGLSVALCISENFLIGKKGACRVHGGGFAGTIQAFIPNEYAEEYKNLMDGVFGKDACAVLSVRSCGAIELTI